MEPATRYSVQERTKIVEAYFTTKSLIQTQRQFRRDFPGRKAPTRATILRLLDKFRETGSVQDQYKGHSGRPRSARTDPNINNVREHLARSPRKSTRRLSQETNLSRTSIMRIMHQDLHMFESATEKTKKDKAKKIKKEDFSSDAKTQDGKKWNLKIVSWNVDGLRAWMKKDGLSVFELEKPDIVCLQETKCSEGNIPAEAKNMKGYNSYFVAAEKEGYSGVALYSKEKPVSVKYGIDDKTHDAEGRCITAEYEQFYLVTAYVPNAGRKLVTLDKRMDWDPKFQKYLKDLDAKKPVILCGDLNVSHKEIDLANPKGNKKNAGFTKEERDGFSDLLAKGFVDSFRHLYPDKPKQYTFWTYMMNCRAKNVGWRLDYFVLSEKLVPQLCDNLIRDTLLGSDHCPITLLMHM